MKQQWSSSSVLLQYFMWMLWKSYSGRNWCSSHFSQQQDDSLWSGIFYGVENLHSYGRKRLSRQLNFGTFSLYFGEAHGCVLTERPWDMQDHWQWTYKELKKVVSSHFGHLPLSRVSCILDEWHEWCSRRDVLLFWGTQWKKQMTGKKEPWA